MVFLLKHFLRGLCRSLFFLALCPLALYSPALSAESGWRELEPGLSFGDFSSDNDIAIDALRLDPAFFNFSLHSAGEDGSPPRALSAWAEQENLAAAVNASMYLPDRATSTGYMRFGRYINNHRINGKFGAFFVATPDSPDLPQAAVLDRESDPWETLLPRYTLAIQNYRLIDGNGRVLWLPGGPAHSCAAVGQDTDGHILFIYCRTPLTGQEFAAPVAPTAQAARTHVCGRRQPGKYAGALSRTSPALGRQLRRVPSGLAGIRGSAVAQCARRAEKKADPVIIILITTLIHLDYLYFALHWTFVRRECRLRF